MSGLYQFICFHLQSLWLDLKIVHLIILWLLSILWRSEGRLHLASDSRISFGTAGSADVGVKVMRLPIRVLGTEVDDAGKLNVLFDRTYGFCYAGNLANAVTFKLLVEDLLVDVQYPPASVPLSFNELCNFLCRFCAKVSTEIVSRLAEQGGYTFLVAGWCPLKETLRGARFQLAQDAGKTVATFEEVVQSEGEYVAVGAGDAEFDTLFAGQEVKMRTVLLTLNKVIDEGKVASVGGDIQYGSFQKDGDFTVFGLSRISVEHVVDDGKQDCPIELCVMRYRGFELYADWNGTGDNLWSSPGFIELQVPSNNESKERFIEQCQKIIAGGT